MVVDGLKKDLLERNLINEIFDLHLGGLGGYSLRLRHFAITGGRPAEAKYDNKAPYVGDGLPWFIREATCDIYPRLNR